MPYLRPRPITVRELESLAKQEGRHSIGDGLILIVGKTRRGCSWTCRLRMPDGRRSDMGLGPYPDVSLAEARQRAAELRRMVRDGLNPIEERKRLRQAKVTFEEAAELCWEQKKKSFRNGKHADQWIQTLRTYAYPKIKNVRIADLSHLQVQEVLEPIWLVKKETARRVLQRIAEVCVWAVSKDLRTAELPKSVVRTGLGLQKMKKRKFPAVPVEDAPRVYQAIKAVGTTAAQALQFQILTALRPGVGRSALWEEFDLDNWLWVIPPERMKADRQHVVPLPVEACHMIKLIKAIPAPGEENSPFVFPSPTAPNKRAISDTSCSNVLKEYAPADTMHGWRSTFRDWAAEYTDFPEHIIEACLAHELEDEVKAAYLRTLFLEERQQLMQAWEDFLEGRTEVRDTLDAAFRRKQRAQALTNSRAQELALSDPA